MRRILTGILFIAGCCILWAQEEEVTDVTQVGQTVPEFRVMTLEGRELNITDLRGKVILINFFATWCGPCNAEMPHLEKDIWQAFKDRDFFVLSIAREHNREETAAFHEEKGVTFTMAPDPDRQIYGLFATKYIPRNILVDKEGKIVFQEKGFDEEKLETMISRIRELLDR